MTPIDEVSPDGSAFWKRHEPLGRALWTLESEFRSRGSPPKMLYHYTTAQGAIGIVQSNELWATSHRYLNDRLEFEHGATVYRHLAERISRINPGQRAREFLAQFEEHLASTSASSVFVFCLSASENQLSQWRAYSGTSGAGYSLGFDSSLLGSLRFFGTTGIRLEKVDYEVASQAEKVTRYLACWARYIDELSEEIYEAEKPTLGIAFFTWLSMTLGGFKNRSFHEEQEYRLISRAWTPQEIGVDSYWFRPSEEGLIVPYGPMSPEAGHLPLKEIWIGPTAEPHLAAFSLAELVRSNGFDVGPNGIVIRDSEIPLR